MIFSVQFILLNVADCQHKDNCPDSTETFSKRRSAGLNYHLPKLSFISLSLSVLRVSNKHCLLTIFSLKKLRETGPQGFIYLSFDFRYSRVHHGQESEVLFHGDEHKITGRTSCHRDGHRARLGRMAD